MSQENVELGAGRARALGPVALNRADRLSFYFCSGYAFRSNAGRLLQNPDVGGVGGC